MKIEELVKQYDKEWLLIKVNEWNKDWEPVDGEVLFHSPSGDEVTQEMLKLKDEKFDLAFRYAGEEFPEEVAFLL